ncbi:MAG TPA: hypothetical protein VFL59_06990 [Candidatus Nanopelagicales bacterium]|nr:hypothetical protein [Candidatus Nanopelagicales bacterium]
MPAATTTPRIRSLNVAVSGGVTTMPTRLMAGTYYVHLSTLDSGASLQVVRPPSTLSLASWYARYLACATHSPGESYATSVRQCRYWRTSATFVGGANVVRVSTYDQLVNPGGRATFAITLAPGRYWFYADTGGAPQLSNGKPLPRIRIRTVTVVGASQRAAVPVAAVLRFPPGSVSFPRLVPRRGFVLGIGEPGVITVLVLLRRKSWVTDADLVPGQCFPDSGGASQALQCFDGYVRLGGGVSAGASALWWYDLPAGDYIAFQGGLDEAGDSGLYPTPTFARVTVA